MKGHTYQTQAELEAATSKLMQSLKNDGKPVNCFVPCYDHAGGFFYLVTNEAIAPYMPEPMQIVFPQPEPMQPEPEPDFTDIEILPETE